MTDESGGGAPTMRVLELSDREEAAAYTGKLLARWGAEVIKVESRDRPAPEMAVDHYLNGGKRRVALDYRDDASRATLERLAASCDLLITDAPARDVEAFGLLSLGGAAGPRVSASVTPFGLSGPYRDYEATPATLLALGGYTWLMGDRDREPLTMPGNYVHYQAGNFAYVALLASWLRERQTPAKTPRTIEIAQVECLTSLHQFTDTMWMFGEVVRSRHGNRWENLCPTVLLPCADGWFGMNILPNFWFPFTQMIGHPELGEGDHPLATNLGRMEYEDEVEALIVEAIGDWSKERIFTEGQETWRVPVGYAATLGEMLDDRHLNDRAFWKTIEGAQGSGAGPLLTAGSPFRFVGEPAPVERAPAVPGGDSEAVIEALGERAPVAGGSNGATDGGAAVAPVRPLEGLRILDLTRIWSGPLATRILADLGADVIKIEAHTGRGPAISPLAPDIERHWNRQGLFNKLNRNKQSVAVDLKSEHGRDLFLGLVAESDVVIENFSARAMPSLGLDYEALRAANESIIYVAMQAFGMEGAYRDYVGLGPSIEPTTGLTALMGYSDEEPRVTSKALTDAIAGTTAAGAVLTAVERRDRTGEGAFVDLSQHEAGVAFLGEHFIERQVVGREPVRTGNAHRAFAPHGVYRCAGEDEWVAIAARDESEWSALCEVAGSDWAADERFGTIERRHEHRAALSEQIEAWTSGLDKNDVMDRLQARDVPAGAVLSAPEWLAERHLIARDYFVELDHAEAGRTSWDGSPLTIDGERGYGDWVAAPLLGENNEAVVATILGRSPAETARLVDQSVLADRPPDA